MSIPWFSVTPTSCDGTAWSVTTSTYAVPPKSKPRKRKRRK